MRILFRKNTSLVQRILNIVFQTKDIEIERLDTQLDLIKSHDSKSIRPDVLAIDRSQFKKMSILYIYSGCRIYETWNGL